MARRRAEGDPELAAPLESSQAELKRALAELRELARGIHPAVLTDRGLDAAICALAGRAPVPVGVGDGVPGDMPAAVASAVYFVVAEALTNVARYAAADRASVTVGGRAHVVRVEVGDDGIGGATPGGGLGAARPRRPPRRARRPVDVESPPGAGTRMRAEIPL